MAQRGEGYQKKGILLKQRDKWGQRGIPTIGKRTAGSVSSKDLHTAPCVQIILDSLTTGCSHLQEVLSMS